MKWRVMGDSQGEHPVGYDPELRPENEKEPTLGRCEESVAAVETACAKALKWDKGQGIGEAQRDLAELYPEWKERGCTVGLGVSGSMGSPQ